MKCYGPVLCQSDGCWYCPVWQTDDYDCEKCRMELERYDEWQVDREREVEP